MRPGYGSCLYKLMTPFGISVLLAFLVLFQTIPVLLHASDAVAIRRFALSIGANNGGEERPPLRYANTDAAAFAKVITELGGVDKADMLLVTDADRNALTLGFSRITQKLNAARQLGQKTELIFYYSGHSDERGLLLKEDIYTYREMRKQINGLPARVRIGILDSCASGSLVRTKGGKRTASFLIDTSAEVKGVALLTSSAADEVAQESDKMGGSYFTHFLVSGMRGAADADRDGRVTLNESYAYAFDETLHRTVDTQAGAQHPNYDFRLAGAGDFVLTDLNASDAVMLFAPEVQGRIFVRDSSGNLVAEINKRSSRPIKFSVPPGRYEVMIDGGDALRRGMVRVSPSRPLRIHAGSLEVISRTKTATRGTHREDAPMNEKAAVYRPVAVGFLPGVSTNGDKSAFNNFAFNVVGEGHTLGGMEIGVVANIRSHRVMGFQISPFHNYAGVLNGGQYSLVNVARYRTVGFQGGLVNVGHTTYGMQTGLININEDVFAGFQGGMLNMTADMIGMQAGLINLQYGEFKGLAIGMANYSASQKGAQIGAVNVSRYVINGAQLSIFNLAQSGSGLQMGLVNIAQGDFNGFQMGIINYADAGLLAPTFWVSDTAAMNLGIKSGNRYNYKILGHSQKSFGPDSYHALVFGFGVHLEFHPIWMELDIIHHWTLSQPPTKTSNDGDDFKYDAVSKGRWVMGFRFVDQFSVFGGIALNNLVSERRSSVALTRGLSFVDVHEGDIYYEFSLGFLLGIQWEPKWGRHNTWRGKRYEAKQANTLDEIEDETN
ncbi:MAG: caspase family protein [Deltaproteobacteria bacterium]|nr:caspase family protein [Deltaproteobacteria bacterium]